MGHVPPRFSTVAVASLALIALPLAVLLAVRSNSGDTPAAFSPSAKPLLAASTPRTVTDERQLRIVATAIPHVHTAFTVRC